VGLKKGLEGLKENEEKVLNKVTTNKCDLTKSGNQGIDKVRSKSK
jgi:hypothetical protein